MNHSSTANVADHLNKDFHQSSIYDFFLISIPEIDENLEGDVGFFLELLDLQKSNLSECSIANELVQAVDKTICKEDKTISNDFTNLQCKNVNPISNSKIIIDDIDNEPVKQIPVMMKTQLRLLSSCQKY
ncbi:226_t:CDS:2 [Gigaspora margarita]|uniref:226_t:CDS:1 n=1 Tax=Gigaspora margarita TaxID=4874 RepID=A0ABN7W2H7_GIGMA|nr:226_t:CDS:2 [Gigaspora margarita]